VAPWCINWESFDGFMRAQDTLFRFLKVGEIINFLRGGFGLTWGIANLL